MLLKRIYTHAQTRRSSALGTDAGDLSTCQDDCCSFCTGNGALADQLSGIDFRMAQVLDSFTAKDDGSTNGELCTFYSLELAGK